MPGSWWVTDLLSSNPAMLVSWVFWVIASITLHELAHGFTAIRLGDRTPIEMGRMTPNPIVHMGWMSLLAFALIGIAWGVMPVNPLRMRGRHAHAIVAAAGPMMNLALAAVCCVLGAVWTVTAQGSVSGTFFVNVLNFFFVGAFLNLVLMAFNLLPVPPLDGSAILASFSRGYARLIENPQTQLIMFLLFLFLFFQMSGQLFSMAGDATGRAMGALVRLMS